MYSYQSTPITPARDGLPTEYHDANTIGDDVFDLSIKKLKTNFFESDQTFTTNIYLKQIRDCQVKFTETNFTASFYCE